MEDISIEVDGIPIVWKADAADDIRFAELLYDIQDGKPLAVVGLMRLAFGEEQYGNLKKTLAHDGRTEAADMTKLFFDAMGKAADAKGNEPKN